MRPLWLHLKVCILSTIWLQRSRRQTKSCQPNNRTCSAIGQSTSILCTVSQKYSNWPSTMDCLARRPRQFSWTLYWATCRRKTRQTIHRCCYTRHNQTLSSRGSLSKPWKSIYSTSHMKMRCLRNFLKISFQEVTYSWINQSLTRRRCLNHE